jgi:hypothetical protein
MLRCYKQGQLVVAVSEESVVGWWVNYRTAAAVGNWQLRPGTVQEPEEGERPPLKPLQSNSSEYVTVDSGVCVCMCVRVHTHNSEL